MADHGAVPDVHYISHVAEDGREEAIVDHLEEVAAMAREFGEPFDMGELAFLAGRYHDIGKYSMAFQRRLLEGGPKVDHSTAGAWELIKATAPCELVYAVAGHHAGLLNGGLRSCNDGGPTLWKRIMGAHEGKLPSYAAYLEENPNPSDEGPSDKGSDEFDAFATSFRTRMLLSCLTDADFLCTERFMEGKKRPSFSRITMGELKERLDRRVAAFGEPGSTLDQVRHDVLMSCRDAALGPQGVYSLTVPTGGGKTLSSLSFALDHAVAHGLSRVIYAIPYTSIIEQTAQVFRDALEDDTLGGRVVLEHHSSVDFEDDAEDDNGIGKRGIQRLAAENWDAPIIVTTNVQLFESLYANRTSKVRKLHNLANSVIVLDEIQMLPVNRIKPCLRALAELVMNYGCTVLLCSATQPDIARFFEEQGIVVHEIVEDPDGLSDALRRVTYVLDGPMDDEELAAELAEADQALCIVNSRRQARCLYELIIDHIGDDGVFHLSTLMHSVHRSRVLDAIRRRLSAGERCIVISTCLIEAGVDVDFPLVYRASTGIDGIVQAGGRCNREGKRNPDESIVHVFQGSGEYGMAREVAQRDAITRDIICDQDDFDFGSLETIGRYFRRLNDANPIHDKGDVLAMMSLTRSEDGRQNYGEGVADPVFPFRFVDAADAFQLIESPATTLIVPDESIIDDFERIRSGFIDQRSFRRISRYGVTVYQDDLRRLVDSGAVECIANDLFVLRDVEAYDPKLGLKTEEGGGRGLFM